LPKAESCWEGDSLAFSIDLDLNCISWLFRTNFRHYILSVDYIRIAYSSDYIACSNPGSLGGAAIVDVFNQHPSDVADPKE
jgi:hypothetical protein